LDEYGIRVYGEMMISFLFFRSGQGIRVGKAKEGVCE